MNRLMQYVEEPEERTPSGDFWVVYGDVGVFYVSADTALRVAKRLERWWLPRWVTFVDLVGSRVRIRAREIQGIYESTPLQRERARSFHRARQLEEQADGRSWEDGE